REGPVHHLQ
nr:immunoglobulin heavy chain junction region [Homo sapiens]